MSSTSIRITKLIVDAANPQIEPKMLALANNIAKRAQRVVPKRTWALHDSIETELVRSTSTEIVVRVKVGGDEAPYWDYVEHGTSRMAAQPYIRPAFLQSRAGDLLTDPGAPTRHGIRRPRP